jgi:SNF2 family DNA or RNA helicase
MTEFFKHQKEVFEKSVDQRYWALFMDAGTGKTLVSIRTAEYWFTNQDVDAIVVFCPKSLIGTWADHELAKHSEVPYSTYKWDPAKINKDDFAKKLRDKSKLFYFILNHDAFASEKLMIFVNAIAKHTKFGVIYDESTAIKNIRTERTQCAIGLAKHSQFRRILTGTPIVQSPLDVFSQTEFLEQGALGFKNFYGFKTRYAVMKRKTFGARSFDVIEGYRDLDDLRSKLEHFSSFIKLEDCVDLPEQIFKQIEIELTPEQRKAYEELRDKALLYIEDHEITAVNALAMLTRLQQIVAGQLKTPDGAYVSLKNNRLTALKELVETTTEPFIVWSTFVNTSIDILKTLGGNALTFTSNTNPEQRNDVINAWRGGSAQVLVLNPQSAGHGLTLNEAKQSVFYNGFFNLEWRLQALRRNYRIGQDSKTVVNDFITRGTVEEKAYAALNTKEDLAKKVTTKDALLQILSN